MRWPRAERRLAVLQPRSAAEVRHAPNAVVAFSAEMQRELDRLRAFLFARVYRHPRIARIMGEAECVVGDLFARYSETPRRCRRNGAEAHPTRHAAYARYIADFIAGMTDRFALAEHRRLFDATPDLR